ncbi:MAG: hypothetical protein Q7R87_02235 [Nanoarchaeota archaeon]|nr:hypothetical protein [Nanoarchaeota archaeon]
MGGKTLRFPKRKKYISNENKNQIEDKQVTSEEHESRVRMLKELGLVK